MIFDALLTLTTIPHSSMYHLIRRFAVAALFLLLLASPDAMAQSASGSAANAEYVNRVQVHVGEMLLSNDVATQKHALTLIMAFAERGDDRIPTGSFRASLSSLYFNTGLDDDIRIMALDSMYATGLINDSVVSIVRAMKADPSDGVRQHTIHVLNELNRVSDAG